MKNFLFAFLGLAAAGCSMNQPADPQAEQRGAAELSAALRGYEPAGPPVSCVSMIRLGGNHSAGDALIFEGRSPAERWVNNPPGGCPRIGNGQALVTRTTQSQLCRGDIASVLDTSTHMENGSCALGDFTPYRRVARR